MKKRKIIYKISLTIGTLITLLSFTGNKPHTPSSFNASIYYHGCCEQYIGTSSGNEDCRDDGLSHAFAFSSANWNSNPNTFTSAGNYIANIEYDTNDFPTVASLLALLSTYYWINNNTLPSDGTTFWVSPGKLIKIYRTANSY